MVVVNGLVSFDGNEVLARIRCQLTVEVGSGDYRFFILREAFCRFLYNGKNFR